MLADGEAAVQSAADQLPIGRRRQAVLERALGLAGDLARQPQFFIVRRRTRRPPPRAGRAQSRRPAAPLRARPPPPPHASPSLPAASCSPPRPSLSQANLQDYSYQMQSFVKLTPSQFCRAAQHFQRGRRLDTLTPFRLAKPAVYEADDEFTLPAPSSASRYQSAVTPHPIKRLGWSSLSLEPEHLSARIEDALQRMDATTEVTERADSEGETFMVHAKLANGTAMRVAVFEDPADGQYRISCTRLSRETFSYHEAFRAMRTHLADAVAPNAAPPPGRRRRPEPTAVAAAAAAAVPAPGPFSLLAASEGAPGRHPPRAAAPLVLGRRPGSLVLDRDRSAGAVRWCDCATKNALCAVSDRINCIENFAPLRQERVGPALSGSRATCPGAWRRALSRVGCAAVRAPVELQTLYCGLSRRRRTALSLSHLTLARWGWYQSSSAHARWRMLSRLGGLAAHLEVHVDLGDGELERRRVAVGGEVRVGEALVGGGALRRVELRAATPTGRRPRGSPRSRRGCGCRAAATSARARAARSAT